MSDDKRTVPLRDIEVDPYLASSVDIEPLAVQEEYTRVPADLAYWNERYARALRAFLKAKAREKQLAALLKIEHRARLAEEGGRVTDAMVDAAVETDERMMEATTDRINADVEKARMFGVVDAVRSKKEMLVSLGAHIRQEMEGDPVIRAAHADARRIRRNEG